MGVISVGVFTSDTETVTRLKLNALAANIVTEFNGNIDNANIKAAAGIANSKLNLATITQAITFNGALTFANDPTLSSGNGLVPSGFIGMWSGAISAIPTGWVICDGTNGTPNLTDRFVIHADSDSGGTNDVGDTGGASTVNLEHNHGGNTGNVTLTGGQSGTSAHRHGFHWGAETGAGTSYLGSEDGPQAAGALSAPISVDISSEESADDPHAHTIANGGSTAQTIRDKYYALAYIMKT